MRDSGLPHPALAAAANEGIPQKSADKEDLDVSR